MPAGRADADADRAGWKPGTSGALVTAASGAVLTPEEVADAVVDGLAAERFLILPHPEVAGYRRSKVRDPDAWLAAMRGIVARVEADCVTASGASAAGRGGAVHSRRRHQGGARAAPSM